MRNDDVLLIKFPIVGVPRCILQVPRLSRELMSDLYTSKLLTPQNIPHLPVVNMSVASKVDINGDALQIFHASSALNPVALFSTGLQKVVKWTFVTHVTGSELCYFHYPVK